MIIRFITQGRSTAEGRNINPTDDPTLQELRRMDHRAVIAWERITLEGEEAAGRPHGVKEYPRLIPIALALTWHPVIDFVEILCPSCLRSIRAPRRHPGRN